MRIKATLLVLLATVTIVAALALLRRHGQADNPALERARRRAVILGEYMAEKADAHTTARRLGELGSSDEEVVLGWDASQYGADSAAIMQKKVDELVHAIRRSR